MSKTDYKTTVVLWTAGVFLLLMSGCLRFDYEVSSLSGVIAEDGSGTPINNVMVTVTWESDSVGVGQKTRRDTSGSEGYYEFDNLPGNTTYSLSAERADFNPIQRQIELDDGVRINLIMERDTTR